MSTKARANNNKNQRALFSVICLCIIALGLIVYFSSQRREAQVNENTTVVQSQTTERTTEVQNRVTIKDTTTEITKTTTEVETKPQETEPLTMEQNETNTPYQSYYKMPCGEEMLVPYSQELIKNETMGDYRAHTAIDFKADAGSKVEAINDGIVISVERNNIYGTTIEIDHGGKLVARYCGLEAVNVSEGAYVTIGQTLGTVGKVPFEAKSESHLHFETKLEGEYVNPLDVMSKLD